METSDKDKKDLPLFTPRKNGSGWDLNLGSTLSYVIVAIILAVPFIVVIIAMVVADKK